MDKPEELIQHYCHPWKEFLQGYLMGIVLGATLAYIFLS